MSTNEYTLERRARRIVVAKNVYKAIIGLWVLAAAAQLLVWGLTTPGGYFWPVWSLLGMTVAAVIAGLLIYGRTPFRVRQDQVAREISRLQADGR